MSWNISDSVTSDRNAANKTVAKRMRRADIVELKQLFFKKIQVVFRIMSLMVSRGR